jgi:transposase
MLVTDGDGTPLAVELESASPAEVKLALRTLRKIRVPKFGLGRPRTMKRILRLIADRGYDSNELRGELAGTGIEPVIPAKRNNRVATHQDGRSLRRYRKRWVIERSNAWLQNFRRLFVRYDRLLTSFGGFVHMACALITLRQVLK